MSPPRRDSRRKKKRSPPRKATAPPADRQTDAETEQAFIESLIASGQAAKPDVEGKLPPGATHELVEEGGRLRVIRRRFSAF